jgi:competence protein ComEC
METARVSRDDPAGAADHIWRAPLIPLALAVTAGIVADRYLAINSLLALIVAVLGLAGWTAARSRPQPWLPLLCIGLSAAALGAAYHHISRETYAEDDIGNLATAVPQPVHLRGVIEEEPHIAWQLHGDPLRSFDTSDPTVAVIEVTQVMFKPEWSAVSGKARLSVAGHITGLHAGDEVDVIGRLVAPRGAANPGEFDYADHLRDQHIRAVVHVQKTPEGVTRLAERWPRSAAGWLGVVRGWGLRVLEQALPPRNSGVAQALLLGEGSTMTDADWDKYIRTGVIHVLAISGQHLAVLAAFLWWGLRLASVRRRRSAIFVALFLFGYALLAGGRPPVLRSAVMVCCACFGLYVRRPAMTANSFALSWLVVIACNPADVFNMGCQLSFLAVAMLYWGTSRWFVHKPDPLEKLVDQTRPAWQNGLRWLGRQIVLSYAVTLAIWLAVAPVVAGRNHLVSPIGIVIGPPVVLLTSIALLSGFLLLICAIVCWPLVPAFAWITGSCLDGCEFLVRLTDGWPGAHLYVGTVPEWWLWGFCLGLFALLMLPSIQLHRRRLAFAGLGWLCLGLGATSARWPSDELRCTFLAVGHGGCTVIETPDGRVLLYDAGAITGPDVARRQIAPYLWERGIRRIDELFLSHADLDHFNGVPALLERFAIGQVTCTPTFADKATGAVRTTLAEIHRLGVPLRIVSAGDRLTAGGIDIEVLHPPEKGPEGNENTRSLVLLVKHAGHSLLLTGDLEGPGMDRVLSLGLASVDILMAPHHGSRRNNLPRLAEAAAPSVVISCEGPPRSATRDPDPYLAPGRQFLGTYQHGAITVRSHQTGLVIETFVTKQTFVVRSSRRA